MKTTFSYKGYDKTLFIMDVDHVVGIEISRVTIYRDKKEVELHQVMFLTTQVPMMLTFAAQDRAEECVNSFLKATQREEEKATPSELTLFKQGIDYALSIRAAASTNRVPGPR